MNNNKLTKQFVNCSTKIQLVTEYATRPMCLSWKVNKYSASCVCVCVCVCVNITTPNTIHTRIDTHERPDEPSRLMLVLLHVHSTFV